MSLEHAGLAADDLDADDAMMVVGLARRLSTAEYARGVLFTGAQGCWVRAAGGVEYLDLMAGYGVASTGWNHPRLVAAATRAAQRTMFAPPMLAHQQAATLSHAILEVMAMPDGWACARASGGADANEQVLKAISAWARARGRKHPVKIARFARAYHGGTTGTLALSDVEQFGLHRPVADPGHPMLPVPTSASDITAFQRLLDADASVAAIFVEPVLGSGGVYPIPNEYLRALRAECTLRGVLLVMDEVITGCGRVGAMLHVHRSGVMPDAVTLGKGITAGAAPLGAALLSPELAVAMRAAEDTSSTFAWTPASCAIAEENLRIIEDEALASKAELKSRRFEADLRALMEGEIGPRAQLRAVGMMFGITIQTSDGNQPDTRAMQRLVLRCERAGLLVGASWDWHSLVLLPPLVISHAELDEALVRLRRALS